MSTIFFMVAGFVAGYLFGRIDEIVRLLKKVESFSFVSSVVKEQKSSARRSVMIDESKFVSDISTKGLTAVNEQNLGDVIKSNDNITSETNKLAQLKKSKS